MRGEKAKVKITVSDCSRESARREPKSYKRDGKIRIRILVAQIEAGQFAPFSRILPRLARGLEAGPSGRQDVAALHHDGGSPLKEEEPVRYPRTRTHTHTLGTDECTQTRRAPAIATQSRGREKREREERRGEERRDCWPYGVLRVYVYSYVTPARGRAQGARVRRYGVTTPESRARGAP